MEIETKVISIETIKPSSPTPKSLQKYQLSFLDQIAFKTFIPFVYFYTPNPNFSNSAKSKQLKKSLSEVLSIYYPLAGRLVGSLYVDCNDAGVPFSEAEADCDVSHFITSPNNINLHKFQPHVTNECQHLCLAVQATYFRCGGLAVAIVLSHKISDALSYILFVNTWSAVARGGGGSVTLPKFDVAHAPPLPNFDATILSRGVPDAGVIPKEIANKIITFSASEIAALQDRYTAGGGRPSRAEALSAFIWTRFTSATGLRSDPSKICTVYNAINLRARADPPLPQHHFGSIAWGPAAEVVAGDGGVNLIRKMRKATKAFDAGYIAGLKGREMQLEHIRVQSRAWKMDVRFAFTKLCGFPLYEPDFGWGKPDRVRFAGLGNKNIAYFMDTKSGDGIEVLLVLTKQDMEKFEALLMLKSNL